MATPQIPPIQDQRNPYFGLILPFDPTTGQPYTQNPITGAPLAPMRTNLASDDAEFKDNFGPEMGQNMIRFKSLTPQDKATVGAQHSQVIQIFKQQMADAQARMQGVAPPQMPPVQMRDPSQHPKPDAAASVIKANPKAKKASADHSFTHNGHQIKLTRAFTKPNAEGICFLKPICPTVWARVESHYKTQLDRKPALVPDDATKIMDSGFSHRDGYIFFEVYYQKDGVLEHRSRMVTPQEQAEIQELEKVYPEIRIAPISRRANRRVTLESKKLAKITFKSAELTATDANPVAVAMHQETIDKAKVLRDKYSVEYAYPYDATSRRDLMLSGNSHFDPILDLKQIKLTHDTPFTFSARTFGPEKGVTRILHDLAPRDGRDISKFSESYEQQLFAEHYPLHFGVNAHLGRIEEKEAPRVAHHRNIFMGLRDQKGKLINPTLIQQGYTIPQVRTEDGHPLPRGFRLQNIVKSIEDQMLVYDEIIRAHIGTQLREITIKDLICSKAPITDAEKEDMALSIFVRMVAALMVNSKVSRANIKVKINFEYPEGLEEADWTALGETHNLIAQRVLKRVRDGIEQKDFIDAIELVDFILAPDDIHRPADAESESDGDSVYLSADEEI